MLDDSLVGVALKLYHNVLTDVHSESIFHDMHYSSSLKGIHRKVKVVSNGVK